MFKTFIGNVARKQAARARLGVKLAYDTSPRPAHKSKASHLPGPLFDATVFGLFVLLGGSYAVAQLWPIITR